MDRQTIGGIGMRPIWLGSCDISASKSLPEGRIFRGHILQTYFLVRASRSKDGQTMMYFKPPQFLHRKKLLKSPPKGLSSSTSCKVDGRSCRVRSTALKKCWWVMGVSSHMRCAAWMSSAVWLPHAILKVQVSLMGMGILKRLSEINISIEEISG